MIEPMWEQNRWGQNYELVYGGVLSEAALKSSEKKQSGFPIVSRMVDTI